MAFKPNYRFERAERDRLKKGEKRRETAATAGACLVAAGQRPRRSNQFRGPARSLILGDLECDPLPRGGARLEEYLVGGCLCGKVRYRVTDAPLEALYCHCRMCQRAHGAPVVAWLTVAITGFTVTSGEPIAYRSSARALRHFCGSCGDSSHLASHQQPEARRCEHCHSRQPGSGRAGSASLDRQPDSLVRDCRSPAALSDQRTAQTGIVTR